MKDKKTFKIVCTVIAIIIVIAAAVYVIYQIPYYTELKKSINAVEAGNQMYLKDRTIATEENKDSEGYATYQNMKFKLDNFKLENSKMTFDLVYKVDKSLLKNGDIASYKVAENIVGYTDKQMQFSVASSMASPYNGAYEAFVYKELYHKPFYNDGSVFNDYSAKSIGVKANEDGSITEKVEVSLKNNIEEDSIYIRVFGLNLVPEEYKYNSNMENILVDDFSKVEYRFKVNLK
ncbi:MAG: hypothetical protein RR922_03780 [Clostridia bacterium]